MDSYRLPRTIFSFNPFIFVNHYFMENCTQSSCNMVKWLQKKIILSDTIFGGIETKWNKVEPYYVEPHDSLRLPRYHL